MVRIDEKTLKQGMAVRAKADPDQGRIRRMVGPPGLRIRDPGFGALLNIIVNQQVSTASGAAIWGRVEESCRPLTAARFLALTDEDLRAIGFSRQKIAYGRGIAEAIDSGRLDLHGLGGLDDAPAIDALVALKGIGRWSAEIYLLSALGRPDVWPADDLALIVAVQRLKGLPARPNRAEMAAIAEPWRPWRAVAARMLWHYYRYGNNEAKSTR